MTVRPRIIIFAIEREQVRMRRRTSDVASSLGWQVAVRRKMAGALVFGGKILIPGNMSSNSQEM